MGIKNVPLEIKQLSFSRLLKIEVPKLAKLVIEIVEKHDPEELQILEIYNLLQEQTPLIQKLNAMYGVHPLTVELKPLREKLLLQVSAMKLQLKLASKMQTEEIVKAASVFNLSVDAYFSKLRSSKNEQVVLEKIEAFLNMMKVNPTVSAAATTLGLQDLIAQMQTTLFDVNSMLLERTALISQRPKEKTSTTIKSVVNAMKYLFKQIEVAQLKHSELDYRPLFHELNDTLDKYRNLINIRTGYNMRKRMEANGEVENAGKSTDKEGEDSTETRSVETPTVETLGKEVAPSMLMANNNENVAPVGEKVNENGSDKALDKSLEEKKAAASSAKHVQLPNLKNEADL